MEASRRPYLVIPKLIKQPTWGGQYIVTKKGWIAYGEFAKLKIGQSYELFSGSNLSLLDTSEDPRFIGELTDGETVGTPSKSANALALTSLIEISPEAALGRDVVSARGANLALLIKYTQALGNSFQVHIKDGVKHDLWKPKPESWYYFEPGLVTLGVKPGVNWKQYQDSVTAIQEALSSIGKQIKEEKLSYEDAQSSVKDLLQKYDPWQFVNTVPIAKDQLVDLSAGGLHHSWEEDASRAPLGNVLYELQAEALDPVSTFRCFDKGKIGPDGSVREMRIKEYFDFIDRSPEVNDPQAHIRLPKLVHKTDAYTLELLLESRHYSLEKLTLSGPSASYSETIVHFRHLFAKEGKVEVSTGSHGVTVTEAHSCFIPAAAGSYTVKNLTKNSELLISY